MNRKSLALLFCLTALYAQIASAQFTIAKTSTSITGVISSVTATNVLLFDNRISIRASQAEIHDIFGKKTLADLAPGDHIRAGVMSSMFGITALTIDVLHEAETNITGVLDNVDLAAGTLLIAGQSVRLAPATELRRVPEGVLASAADLRPLQHVYIELDPAESVATAKLIAFTPNIDAGGTFTGKLTKIDGNLWTFDAGIRVMTLLVTPDTAISGSPQVGDRVLVSFGMNANGDLIALSIGVTASIGEDSVTGELVSISATSLTVSTPQGNATVALDAKTVFRGGTPQVGDLVNVRLTTLSDGSKVAAVVERVTATDETFTFDGNVQSISQNRWTIDHVDVVVTRDTKVVGAPKVGDHVHVVATKANDTWYAVVILKR